MQAKIDTQLVGLSCGYLASWHARPYLQDGCLVARIIDEPKSDPTALIAWRIGNRRRTFIGDVNGCAVPKRHSIVGSAQYGL